MAGRKAVLFLDRGDKPGKFLGGAIALGQVHDAHRGAKGAGLHRLTDLPLSRRELLEGEWGVGEAFDSHTGGTGADHRSEIQRQIQLFLWFIITVLPRSESPQSAFPGSAR